MACASAQTDVSFPPCCAVFAGWATGGVVNNDVQTAVLAGPTDIADAPCKQVDEKWHHGEAEPLLGDSNPPVEFGPAVVPARTLRAQASEDATFEGQPPVAKTAFATTPVSEVDHQQVKLDLAFGPGALDAYIKQHILGKGK